MRSLSDWVAYWARDRSAVACADHVSDLSYFELDRRASAVALELQRRAICRGDSVAVLVERTVDIAVAFIGVLRAGGVLVPLDPALPDSRLEDLASGVAVRAVVASQSLVHRGEQLGRGTPLDIGSLQDAPSNFQPIKVSDDSPMYIMFTSGSSGIPKAVGVSRRALSAFLDGFLLRTGFIDRRLSTASLSSVGFDMICLDVFGPLRSGGTSAICRGSAFELRVDLARFAEQYENLVVQTTPSTWQFLLKLPRISWERITAVCGGESLSDALKDQLVGRCVGAWNFYGPTEATVYCTAQHLSVERPVTLGTALPGYEVVLVDPGGVVTKGIGAQGEIAVMGDGVALGYLNDPSRTAEKFVDLELAGVTRRSYLTGDLGAIDGHGDLVFKGRRDNQVQLDGIRVELEEVESELLRCPALTQAGVAAVRDVHGRLRLIAQVVPVVGAIIDRDDVVRFLQNRLPRWCQPSAIYLVEALPLTERGKLDRSAIIASHNASRFVRGSD